MMRGELVVIGAFVLEWIGVDERGRKAGDTVEQTMLCFLGHAVGLHE